MTFRKFSSGLRVDSNNSYANWGSTVLNSIPCSTVNQSWWKTKQKEESFLLSEGILLERSTSRTVTKGSMLSGKIFLFLFLLLLIGGTNIVALNWAQLIGVKVGNKVLPGYQGCSG